MKLQYSVFWDSSATQWSHLYITTKLPPPHWVDSHLWRKKIFLHFDWLSETYHRWFHPLLCAIHGTPLPRFPGEARTNDVFMVHLIFLLTIETFEHRKEMLKAKEVFKSKSFLGNRFMESKGNTVKNTQTSWECFLPVSFYRGLRLCHCHSPRAVPCIIITKWLSVRFTAAAAASQTYPTLPALTLRPWTCLQSWLGPTAFLHHLDVKGAGRLDVITNRDLQTVEPHTDRLDIRVERSEACVEYVHSNLHQGWCAFMTLVLIDTLVSRCM